MKDIRGEPQETIIEPTRGLRLFAWRELYAYRDLLWLLVWRDIAARYKQTVLGPLWYIVQPLLTTVVFSLVFARFARIPTAGVQPMLFYLAGLLGWNYFSQTFNSTSSSLVNNAALFGKVYFPRLIVPLAGVVSNLVPLALQFLAFGALWMAFVLAGAAATPAPSVAICWTPAIFCHIAALSLGTGLWLTALATRYRDFTVVAGFLLQLWLYATPVIYPFAQIPARWRPLSVVNPMTMPVEALRKCLIGAGSPEAGAYVLSVVATLAVLLSGLAVFRTVERTFVDVI